ncbi:MAG: hypothetical protein U1F11_07670 [Steroidobacteraceae bacterium]
MQLFVLADAHVALGGEAHLLEASQPLGRLAARGLELRHGVGVVPGAFMLAVHAQSGVHDVRGS